MQETKLKITKEFKKEDNGKKLIVDVFDNGEKIANQQYYANDIELMKNKAQAELDHALELEAEFNKVV